LEQFFKNWKQKFENALEQVRVLGYEKKFGEREDDIYIAGFPRSGNTLLQVMVYHLTHEGGMQYGHLDEVSPWLRNLAAHRLTIPQIGSPRIIKTHDPYSLIPPDRKGKFIFVLRQPADVAVSVYHHWKNYNDPALGFNEVFEKIMRSEKPTAYFEFNRAWLENKKHLPVLYLHYEEMITDKRTAIKAIGSFLGLVLDDVKIEEVVTLSNFETMKRNENKFGEQPLEKLPGRVYNQFIRKGVIGEGGAMLSDEQQQFCSRRFEEMMNKTL
jgi:hypothetical protein